MRSDPESREPDSEGRAPIGLLLGCALIAVLGALGSGLRAQTVLFIDPVSGQDLPSRGTQGAPLKTLSYATTLAATGIVVHDYRLAPGVYSSASGETFPIRPPRLSIVQAWPNRPGAREAVLDAGGAGTAIEFAPAAVGFLQLRGLELRGADRSVDCISPPSGPIDLAIADSHLSGHLRFEARSASVASLVLDRARIDDGVSCFQGETGVLQLNWDRSELKVDPGGSRPDILWIDGSGSTTVADIRSCAFLAGTRSAVRLTESRPATWGLRFEHCSFIGNGRQSGSVRGAALDPALGPNPQGVGFLVQNCLFVDNSQDAPVGGAFCTFGTNLVEQIDLIPLGSNIFGRARLVDAAGGDFRLAPGSPGIDRADLGATTLFADLDGDLRWSPAEPVADLGCDELYLDSVHTASETRLGTTWEFVVRTDPNLLTALVVGTDTTGLAPEIDGLRIGGALITWPIAVTSDVDGIARFDIPTPANPSLIGLRLFWQAGVARAPFFGSNVWQTYIRR